jgi:hypothetical protein
VHRRASPTLIIALALLMSAPSIEAAITGALTIDTLCVRLAMAVVVSYVGVRTLTSIVVGYATSPRLPRPERSDSANDADIGV